MDMSTSTTMDMAVGTATAASSSATSSVAAMDMSGGAGCQISMLWNWYTVDSCFIATSWHIRSKGMFAGSCIGVVLLVMTLEFLRRASKEYDQYIFRQAQKNYQLASTAEIDATKPLAGSNTPTSSATSLPAFQFRPNVFQQAIRAVLHMVQFAVAYFVMLLAMYFNGYIIISIIIGAYLGAFVFSWETIKIGSETKQEATYCCG